MLVTINENKALWLGKQSTMAGKNCFDQNLSENCSLTQRNWISISDCVNLLFDLTEYIVNCDCLFVISHALQLNKYMKKHDIVKHLKLTTFGLQRYRD